MRTWDAAAHVLASPMMLHKARKYVNAVDRTIDVPAMLEDAKETWSTGEIIMTQVAADFYNGSGHADFAELIQTLDEQNLRVVLESIAIYRWGR